jgi:hypothetical protein
MTSIIDRIERQLGVPGIATLLAERLEPADLQSLLLDVYTRLAARRPPATVLSDFTANRFVHPSRLRPTQFLEWDRVAFAVLPAEFEALELSPVCPLGTASVLAELAQDWALSTIRNTEVVSDSTNVLALEATLRRRALKRDDPRSATVVNLAASHRLLRTRHYDDPRLSSHFRVFSLCSAGRDTGGFRMESDTIGRHIAFYITAIRAYVGESATLRVSLTALDSNAASTLEILADRIRREFVGAEVVLDPDRAAARNYYRGVCFGITGASMTGEQRHLVDGGRVDWTQRLLGDAKERLVISGVGSDRICDMRTELDSRGARG